MTAQFTEDNLYNTVPKAGEKKTWVKTKYSDDRELEDLPEGMADDVLKVLNQFQYPRLMQERINKVEVGHGRESDRYKVYIHQWADRPRIRDLQDMDRPVEEVAVSRNGGLVLVFKGMELPKADKEE